MEEVPYTNRYTNIHSEIQTLIQDECLQEEFTDKIVEGGNESIVEELVVADIENNRKDEHAHYLKNDHAYIV